MNNTGATDHGPPQRGVIMLVSRMIRMSRIILMSRVIMMSRIILSSRITLLSDRLLNYGKW